MSDHAKPEGFPVTIGNLADLHMEQFRLFCRSLNVNVRDCLPHAHTYVALVRNDEGLPMFANFAPQTVEDIAILLALHA